MEAPSIGKTARDVAAAYRIWWTARTGEWLTHDSETDRDLRSLIESIRYRYESLLFHVNLLEQTAIGANDHVQARPHTGRRFLRSVATQQQYVFDDLVFNVMSLFDYVGCLIGFVIEGPSERSIKWSKACGKVRSLAQESPVWPAMQQANGSLVKRLERYRSELIHHFSDEVGGWIRRSYTRGTSELTITVPEWFTSRVRLPGIGKDTSVEAAARRIVDLAGGLVTRVLSELVNDLANRDWEEAPPNPLAMEARWQHAGYLRRLAECAELRSRGVNSVGAIVTERSLELTLSRESGGSLRSAPIDLLSMFSAGVFGGPEVEATLRGAALAALESADSD